MPKGDVLADARVAGIMAAKSTPQILPLCHPLLLTHVAVDLEIDRAGGCVRVTTRPRRPHQTGVEMEALCAAAAAALCVHDMCKSLDPAMTIDDICLVSKRAASRATGSARREGRRHDRLRRRRSTGSATTPPARSSRRPPAPRASTWPFAGSCRTRPGDQRRRDRPVRSRDRVGAGHRRHRVRAARHHSRGPCGRCIDRLVPGIDEAMRAASMAVKPHGMLTRGVSGIRGTTLVLSFPGSPRPAPRTSPSWNPCSTMP